MASVLKYLTKAAEPFHADRRRYGKPAIQAVVASESRVMYVGNLSFYTTEDQVHALFSKAGLVERVIMGLNRITKTPCGFCFVIFAHRQGLVNAATFLNGTKLDDRVIRIEVDKGFREGRQYGRAASGGQVRDDLRTTYDADRGGYGQAVAARGAPPIMGGSRIRGPPPRGAMGMAPGSAMPRGPTAQVGLLGRGGAPPMYGGPPGPPGAGLMRPPPPPGYGHMRGPPPPLGYNMGPPMGPAYGRPPPPRGYGGGGPRYGGGGGGPGRYQRGQRGRGGDRRRPRDFTPLRRDKHRHDRDRYGDHRDSPRDRDHDRDRGRQRNPKRGRDEDGEGRRDRWHRHRRDDDDD